MKFNNLKSETILIFFSLIREFVSSKLIIGKGKKISLVRIKRGIQQWGLILFLSYAFTFISSGQTTFTSPTNPTGNWTTIAWVKSGTATSATYPGEIGGENHIVVIGVTGNGLGRTLNLNVNITQSVSDVSINYIETRTATLNMGNNTLTMTGNLTGNGIVTMGSGTLNIGGSNTIGTFNSGTGTVNYNKAGAQTVGTYTYNNLTLSGSGVKTTTGVNVNGILSMEGTATATATPTYGATATLQYKGTALQTTGPEFPASVYDLIINNGSGLTLSGSKTVTHNFTMNLGNISTGAFTLFLSNNYVGSLLYGSGTIIGQFKRSISTTADNDYLFPVGTATNYLPATLNFSTIPSTVDITCSFIAVAPAGFVPYADGSLNLDNIFTDGYWRFSSSATPVSTYTLKLAGDGFSSYSVNEITRITGRDNTNSTWRGLGLHGSQSGNEVSRTGVTNLNTTSFDYGFATSCVPSTMGYIYERNITIDYTKVSGGINLSNFPVLIYLTGQTFLKTFPAGKLLNANGYDLIFTDANYNKLDHQVEYYNGTNGDMVAWVRVPTLSASSNTIIKILYENPKITTDLSVTSVWDSHYKGVWHLDNSSLNDFTIFNKSGTPYNGPTYPVGRVYNALGLNGSSQYVDVINDPNINFTGNLTVSGWIYMNAGVRDQKIAGNENGTSGGYKFGVYTNNKVEFEIRNAANTPTLNREEPGGTVLNTGQWYYVAGISSDVLDSIKTFVSGIPERPFKKTGTLGVSSNNLTIGKEPWQANYYFSGRIDELRVSNEVRSNGWLRTEFNSQSSPATFYSIDNVDSPADYLPSSSICTGPITLTFGYPSGGTYSGDPNISGNIFTPPVAGTYSITYTYNNGCGPSSVSKDIIITAAPPAPVASNKQYCTGQIAYLNATSGDNIRWYSGATLVSTANPFSTGQTVPGTYNYTCTQTINGCESTSTPVTLTIFSSTTITSQPVNQSKCAGSVAGFRIKTTGPNLTYQWKKGAVNLINGPNISGATSDTLTLSNLIVSDAGSYTCVVSSSCGTPLTSTAATLTVDPQPTPGIAGNNAVCESTTFVYNIIAPVGGHTYNWTVKGGTITPPPTGTSISVNWTTAGNDTVFVTETATAGCFTKVFYPVKVTATPTATISYSGTPFCTSSGTGVVTFSGTPGGTYTASPGGLSINAATGDINPGSSTPGVYTVTYTTPASGGCTAVIATTPVTINATPAAPTGTAAQSFCSASLPTVANLSATGTAIQWYAASSGGTALATTTALENGTHYYASQTVGGCESTSRFDVTATINTTPSAPTGSASQTFCSGSSPTVANLTATGTAIKWYAASSGGTALVTTTPLVSGTHYYATQTINGCESTSRFDVTATINATPGAPTGSASQSFCSGTSPTVANLSATGTAIKWYAASSGGTALVTTTPLVNNTHYFASQTVGGCESTARFDVTATVTTTPSAPTGSDTQTFCSGASPKVSDLTATGSNLQWYSTAVGGIPLAIGTALGNGNDYYASQTIGGCESTTRFDVTVTINTTPVAPTGLVTQPFCSASLPTVSNLAATGSAIKWYDAATGGTLYLGTDILVDGNHYYASQTVNGCESTLRLNVTATVNVTPAVPTGSATQSFCSSASHTINDLVATGSSIKWYAASSGGSALLTTTTLINGTHYYATQTVNGCESTTRLDVTAVVNTTPLAPTGFSPQTFCSGASPTIADLVATGTAIQWYDFSSGGVPLATSTALGNGIHYYATQTENGCESTGRLDVTATVNTTPIAPSGTAAQSFCSGDLPTIANLSATGTSIQWYDAASGGSMYLSTDVLVDGNHYYASQTVSGCESIGRFDVTVTVNTTPAAPTGVSPQLFCSDATPTVADLAVTGSTILWYSIAVGGVPLANGTVLGTGNHYFASQTVSGCESTSRLDILATINPTPSAPTGASTQTFCSSDSPVIGDLIATGSSIQWYDAAVGGTLYVSTDPLGNGNHYFASQTVAGCESTDRLEVTVTVNTTPVEPTGSANQSFCSDASHTINDLVATGTAIQWYDAIIGGTVYTGTDILIDGNHYYASQTVNGCESTVRLDVTATINPTPLAPTGTSPQSFCSDALPVVGDLVATGTSVQWYDADTGGTLLLSTDLLSDGTHYYASQTSVDGCESTDRFDLTAIVNASPAAPTGDASQIFCSGSSPTIADLVAIGTSIKWYDDPTAGNLLASSDALGNGTHYYASQTSVDGCESTARLDVTATVNVTPSAPTGNATQTFCAGATVADLTVATGIGIKWYDALSGGTLLSGFDVLIDGNHYFASQTVTGCESILRFDVVVTVNPVPIITTTTPGSTCGTGTVTLGATASAGIINWYDVSSGGTSLGTGTSFFTPIISSTTTYYVDATSLSCTTGTRTAIVATVYPSLTAPVVSVTTAITCNGGTATVTLLGGGGTAPLSYTFDGVTNGTGIFAGIPAGAAYAWSVTDANGCGPVSGTLDVTQPALAKVEFTVATLSENESNADHPLSVPVIKVSGGVVCAPAKVDLNFGAGTATFGTDYTQTSNQITIPAGDYTSLPLTISIPAAAFTIIGDQVSEPNETINMTVSGASNVDIGTQNSIVLTIVDDDILNVQFTTSTASESEGNIARAILVPQLRVSGVITTSTTAIDLSIVPGTAQALDYTQSLATITIPAGNYISGVDLPIPQAAIQINGDLIVEPDETLILGLINPSGLVIGAINSCTYTIQNDDGFSATTTQVNVLCFNDATGSATVTVFGGTLPYTYSWNTIPIQTGITATGLKAGNYTVTVTDANSFTTSANVIITQPTEIILSVSSQTNVACFGASTGSISILASGGVGPYQYRLDAGSFQGSSTFSSLVAASYVVTVRDANLCTTTIPFNITQPASALSGFITSQINTTCYGDADGSVTVNGSGGTLSYQYSLNGGSYQVSGTFNTLTAGGYTVTVKDANNCTFNVPVTITQPTALAGTVTSQTNVLCFGALTGSVTISAAGGTSPYQYSIDGNAYQASGTFNGLSGGTHSVSVRDNKLCTAIVNLTITQPATAVSGSISSQINVLCFGGSSGSVTVIGSGGTSPYQYSLNGAAYVGSGAFGSLSAGSHTVTVRDANACTFIVPVTITQPAAALSGSITTQINVLCYGEATGSITITGAGGTSPYQYSLNGMAYQGSGTFSSLLAGNHTVTVRDANLCTFNVPITLIQPVSALSGSIISQTNVACFSGTTGSVTVAGTGGTSPYQYSIDGGSYQALGTFNSLNAGIHTITIRDNNLCTFNIIVNITQPSDALSGTISGQTNVLCFGGSTGAVTVAGAGGTSPYEYKIGSGLYQSSGTFGSLTFGSYIVTVRDVNLCTTTVLVNITQPASAVTGSASVTTPITCNGGTATVTLIGGGGAAPLSYTFNGVTNGTGIFAAIPAGAAYAWSVTDVNGCGPVSGTLDVTQPLAVTGSITSQTDVSVFGGNDGEVTVAGSGGTSPYQYSLDGGTYQGTGTFGPLTAGSYTVTIQDINLCTIDIPVTITQPVETLSGSIISQTDVACFGTSTGSVTVEGSGGVTAYEYSLDAGSYLTSGTFGSLAAGTYTVTVRDGVLSTFDVPVTITQPSSAVGGIINSQTNILCYGSNTGSITIDGSGGVAPYQYKMGTGAYQVSGTFGALTAGSYTVTVQDANLCTFDVPFTITQPALAFTGNISAQTDVSCFGSSDGSVTVSGAGGTSPYDYSVDGTTYQAGGIFNGLSAATYTITVRDANLCTIAVTVNITEPAVLSIAHTKVDASCPGTADGSIALTITGGTQPYSAIWSDGISTADRQSIPDGTYSVVVTDLHDCAESIDVVVDVTGSGNCIEIPEIITPNNDGYNDTWIIRNIDLFPNAEVFVFSRWGKQVFHTKNIPANPWDGTLKGKILPTDSYHYILHLNDGSEPRSGVISVIR